MSPPGGSTRPSGGERTSQSLAARLAERIGRDGPVPFAEVMRLALYDPADGFYSSGGAAGRRGDFITSPEVGPLFGAVVARALDAEWQRLGRPSRFTVVEAGAGVGTLAISVRAAAPACLTAGALRYVLVEQSPALRARHGDHLPLDGPFTSATDLPDGPVTGAILANELLDNLPVRLLARDDGAWHEVHVTVRGPSERAMGGTPGGFTEVLVPADGETADRASALVPEASDGARIPLADDAAAWLARAREVLARGMILLFDYGAPTAELATRPATEWLRTYRGHERGGPPLDALGDQDITCEVPVDQLPGLADERQDDWLRRHGIGDLVAEGRRAWATRTITDLAAIRARSRVHEADALLEPTGLGAFRVLTARQP